MPFYLITDNMFPANTKSVITMSESTGEFQAFINGMYNTQNLHATCLHLLEYINKKKIRDVHIYAIYFFIFVKTEDIQTSISY